MLAAQFPLTSRIYESICAHVEQILSTVFDFGSQELG